ncbi:acetate/propionate family kinase [Candidatus Woesearchaeota archaeon]|nr:acetate/propionate family kinase [Candidatus Woesearchaeota archaeon]
MKILVLNVGSSSVKYEVFEEEKSMLKGAVERIKDSKGFSDAVRKVAAVLKRRGMVVDAVGHRVVHGGSIESTSRIDSSVIKRIEKVKDLAPLHNVPELRAIRSCMELFSIPQLTVFDTAFHHTIPEKAYTYAIPPVIAKKHGIRKYGFHGTSHEYVAREACKKLRKDFSRQRMITCHLGNGCSITAIKNGKSIDTSMGLTPLEGLVMGTRCGDIDPGALLYLQRKGYSQKQLDQMLNRDSGLKGLSGISNDFRDILRSESRRAKLAIDVFLYRIVKYIGAYNAVLGGTDILVFTGGIGENNSFVMNTVKKQVKHLGIGKVIAVKTDEARMIARNICDLIHRGQE